MYMKGGDALYRYDVQSTTTLPMTPEQIHQLGLSEVARITKEFEKVRVRRSASRATSTSSSITCARARSSSRRAASSCTQDFYRLKTAVDAKVPQYFSLVPKTPLVIRPYPAVPREVRSRRVL